jgi:hypothetical protein
MKLVEYAFAHAAAKFMPHSLEPTLELFNFSIPISGILLLSGSAKSFWNHEVFWSIYSVRSKVLLR